MDPILVINTVTTEREGVVAQHLLSALGEAAGRIMVWQMPGSRVVEGHIADRLVHTPNDVIEKTRHVDQEKRAQYLTIHRCGWMGVALSSDADVETIRSAWSMAHPCADVHLLYCYQRATSFLDAWEGFNVVVVIDDSPSGCEKEREWRDRLQQARITPSSTMAIVWKKGDEAKVSVLNGVAEWSKRRSTRISDHCFSALWENDQPTDHHLHHADDGVPLDREAMWLEETIRQSRKKLQSSPELMRDDVQFESFVEATLLGQMDEAPSAQEKVSVASLVEKVMATMMGVGPIQSYMDDPAISEIMVNGPADIYIERGGRVEKTDRQFDSEDHLRCVIDRLLAYGGKRIDESRPACDARFSDGSRIHAIIPPLAIDGSSVTIRKFKTFSMSGSSLVQQGSITDEGMRLLERAVRSRRNVVVSGGTGSGKTTLLNMMAAYIDPAERMVTIEDAAELNLQHPHVVRLESRPPNIEGGGEVTIRDLVRHALRMRPDRIIVGECRGNEALDMLQAMNTGHLGSMTTVHANGPRETLTRLESMVMMAGVQWPIRAMREQIAGAVHLIVHISRMPNGDRKVMRIEEVVGMEGDVIVLQPLYVYSETGPLLSPIPPRFDEGGRS